MTTRPFAANRADKFNRHIGEEVIRGGFARANRAAWRELPGLLVAMSNEESRDCGECDDRCARLSRPLYGDRMWEFSSAGFALRGHLRTAETRRTRSRGLHATGRLGFRYSRSLSPHFRTGRPKRPVLGERVAGVRIGGERSASRPNLTKPWSRESIQVRVAS